MNGVLIFEGGSACLEPRVEASDVVQNLPDIYLAKAVRGALITIEVASIRVAFGVDPGVNPQRGHLLEAGDVLEVRGSALLRRLRFINATPGSTAVLQVTVLV